MLTSVAAFIISSVALTGATGGIVATESADYSRMARTSSASADLASAPVEESVVARSGARGILDQLTSLQSREIAGFVAGNPAAISRLLLNPPSASSVASWWRLAPSDTRSALSDTAPELVGNLDGLPVALRDTANREFLASTITTLESSLGSLGRADQGETGQRLHMLKEVQEALVTSAGQPARRLLSVDTAWPGRAAVVIGDLETADFVSYMVPGMFFTVDNQMVDWSVITQDLYDEQVDWVHRLGRSDPNLRGARVAAVSWIGYQTPGIMEIASLDLAKQGAKYISSSVDGLKATRSADEPYVTLVTHSYGSTATMMALQDGAVEVDSLVIIGSPGASAQSVDDLRMPADRVFVGEAAWDPVVNSAFFGSDPGAESFGASRMRVSGGTDAVTGRALTEAVGHLGYFDAGTEAMRNMALVGLGRGDLVSGSSTDVAPEFISAVGASARRW